MAGKDTYLCTPEAAGPIGKFIVKMIVIHVGEITVPIDIAKMSMTLVQVIVGQQHTSLSAGTKYAKTVKCDSEEGGMLICIALVGKALPGVAMIVVLHVDRMAPA